MMFMTDMASVEARKTTSAEDLADMIEVTKKVLSPTSDTKISEMEATNEVANVASVVIVVVADVFACICKINTTKNQCPGS